MEVDYCLWEVTEGQPGDPTSTTHYPGRRRFHGNGEWHEWEWEYGVGTPEEVREFVGLWEDSGGVERGKEEELYGDRKGRWKLSVDEEKV